MSTKEESSVKWFAVVLVGYAVLSFAYSFLAFLHPTLHPERLPEYTLTTFIVEIGGHFLFALVAAIPLGDPILTLLAGCMGVAIDTDHILSALGLRVSAQPSHSILFAAIGTVFMLQMSKRLKSGDYSVIRAAPLVSIAMLAHISYDIFASYNESARRGFPLLLPFRFRNIPIPYTTWPIFEVAAFLLAILCNLLASKQRR